MTPQNSLRARMWRALPTLLALSISGGLAARAETIASTISIAGPGQPAGIAVNPTTNHIYVTTGGDQLGAGHSVVVLDGASNSALATIDLPAGSSPRNAAWNASNGEIYVSLRDGASVAVIDASDTFVRTVFLDANALPQQIAVDPVRNLVYVASYNAATLYIIDGATDQLVGRVAVTSAATGVAVNPTTGRVYVVGHDSQVRVVDPTTRAVVKTIATGAGANYGQAAYDPRANKVYVALDAPDGVAVIDAGADALVRIIPFTLDDAPMPVIAHPVNGRVYVGAFTGRPTKSGAVRALDDAADTIAGNLDVGQPGALAINPVTNVLYVADAGYGTVSVISGLPSAGIPGPQGPAGPQGAAGPQGPAGAQGAAGPQGPAGTQGAAGPQGAQGPQGVGGATGQTGVAGPIGASGPKGDSGVQGPAGPQGPAGTKGDAGLQGPAGPTLSGAVVFVHVTSFAVAPPPSPAGYSFIGFTRLLTNSERDDDDDRRVDTGGARVRPMFAVYMRN